MVNLVFSLVLYKNKYDEINLLIENIKALREILFDYGIDTYLYINDNSPKKIISSKQIKNKFIVYEFNNKNIGFGRAHNKNLLNKNLKNRDIFIIVNPDIKFDPIELLPLIIEFIESDDLCTSPLIKNERGKIQFSVKTNPTFLSLLIGRFQFLRSIKFLDKYYINHINLHKNYLKQKIESTYLSGCFLIIKSKIFMKINGFDPQYFLHLEDADITRTISLYGKATHNPTSTVIHKWARGSHKSPIQMFYLVSSMIKYFKKWGFSIF